MSQNRLNERRIYEGEWWFYCQSGCGDGYAVHYALNEYEDHADSFLTRYALGQELCTACGKGWLDWAGYSGDSPISNSLVRLLSSGHYMASTVILSAIIESSIQNLLWATLVDSGIDKDKANAIADSRLSRPAMIDLIRQLAGIPIQDIAFPSRNLVAHGKGFLQQESTYRLALIDQFGAIKRWLDRIEAGQPPPNFMPTERERWILFMTHWASWCDSYVVARLLVDSQDTSDQGKADG